MPGQQRRWQVLRRLRKKAVRIQVHLESFAVLQFANRLVAHGLAELMFQIASPGSIRFFEWFLLWLQLRSWQRRNIDVFEELPADGRSKAPGIERHPLPVMFLELFHFAR